MFRFARTIFPALGVLACLVQPAVVHAGEQWQPINADELKMTSEPKAPGAMAIYLYRQVDRDDVENRETNYARIKIFTEEGRKYADIEIPYVKDFGNIKNIQARTIKPDGQIVNFDGKIFDKMVVKAKGVKFLAKTFTMPDVQPGSIIEYRYTRLEPEGWVYDSRWLLSEELFTKRAVFSLRQNREFALQWSWPRGLPAGTKQPAMDHGNVVRMETQDIPAFQIEDYMPPQDEMKFRVDFMYTHEQEKDSEKFWKEHAKSMYQGIETFTEKRKAMEQALSQIVSPSDTPQQKLEKIYARCQKVRNTSFEREKSQQEIDREKLKQINNVEDVWKRGYGNGWDITWLFLALSRSAGFEASPVLVSTRDRHFFNPKLMNTGDLNTNVVVVKLDGKDLYLDPGVAFAPFGILPWYETGVIGLRIEKDGGTWITTSRPAPEISGVERAATLELDDSGNLEGEATLTFKGVSALQRRIDENEEDDTQKKKFLEEELKAAVPIDVEAELTNTPEWRSSSPALVAKYHIKIAGWASNAGRRTLMPAAVFSGGEKHIFEGANRVQPIYFEYTFADSDTVTIKTPSGWQASNLPQPRHTDEKVCAYDMVVENKAGALVLNRRLMVNVILVDPNYYGGLRNFFQAVRNGDDQQILLSSVSNTN
ncbi:MAG TPA: DUF3857 domain-containing protein [Candidatus Solibacter sp.]|nr:DUF3857 domain-containing protein [Candidatus Solibacter sp.]